MGFLSKPVNPSREKEEKMPSRESYLAQADQILNQKTFGKEDSSKVQNLLLMADQRDPVRMKLRRAALLEDELELGIRSPEARASGEVYERFMQTLRYGVDALSGSKRALSLSVDSAGGFTVPFVFAQNLYSHMAAYDALFSPDVVTFEETATGGSFSQPILHDELSTAHQIVENQIYPENDDLVFGDLVLGKALTFRSDMVRVSNELVQDSKYPVDAVLAQALGLRLSRGVGTYLAGVLKAAAVIGKVGASGQTASIVYEDLIDLSAAVNPAYLSSPKAAWAMNYRTLQYIQKLKDSVGRPMKLVQRIAGAWEMLGFPVRICPSFDDLGVGSPAVGNLPIAFGDLGSFHVRVVTDGIRVLAKRERYAENFQTAFLGFWRGNAGLAIASGASSPIQFYQNSSS